MKKKNEEVLTEKETWDESNTRLTKEEKEELTQLTSKDDVKFLVDQYYQSQDHRLRCENQIRAMVKDSKSNITIDSYFIRRQLKIVKAQENLTKKYIDRVTDSIPMCQWLKSITGIGPVLAANIYANFDVSIGKYATDFLSYAGLNNNNNPWLGTKKAKDLCTKIESKFMSLANGVKCEFEDEVVRGTASNRTKVLKKYIAEIKVRAKKADLSLEEIVKIANNARKSNGISDEVNITHIDDIEILPDAYIRAEHATYIGRWHLIQAHVMTKRKIENIEKGIQAIAQSKYYTLSDLQNYLARPPYNTKLKKRMFLIGEAFVKVSGKESSLYGRLYLQRKADEIAKNERGEYADQAKKILEEKNWDKSTDAYKCLSEGKLSKAHINMRAQRYATKLFISHVYEAMYWEKYHKTPKKYYTLEFQGHHDYIAPETDYKDFF